MRSACCQINLQESAERLASSKLSDAQEMIRRMEGRGGPTGMKREFLDFEGAEREMKAEIRLLRGKVRRNTKHVLAVVASIVDNGWG